MFKPGFVQSINVVSSQFTLSKPAVFAGWAVGWAGGSGTGGAGQKPIGNQRNGRCSSAQRTIHISSIQTRYETSSLKRLIEENFHNLLDVKINILFFFLLAKKKQEEDEDDMADLEAWATNWARSRCGPAARPLLPIFSCHAAFRHREESRRGVGGTVLLNCCSVLKHTSKIQSIPNTSRCARLLIRTRWTQALDLKLIFLTESLCFGSPLPVLFSAFFSKQRVEYGRFFFFLSACG